MSVGLEKVDWLVTVVGMSIWRLGWNQKWLEIDDFVCHCTMGLRGRLKGIVFALVWMMLRHSSTEGSPMALSDWRLEIGNWNDQSCVLKECCGDDSRLWREIVFWFACFTLIILW